MGAYTKEELERIHAMRQQERADGERSNMMWNAAYVGFEENETVYVIEYRHDEDPTWYGASPFFTPLRLRPEETHSRVEAEEVAALLLAHERATGKQSAPGSVNVTAVRVIERYSSAKIIKLIG